MPSPRVMEKKDHILKEVLKKFLQNGIRDVKISDLTRELNVSSKTLYQHFDDKKGLISDSFHLYLKNTATEFTTMESNSSDVAQLLVRFYQSAITSLAKANPAFFRDLSVSYPEIWSSEDAFGLLHARNMIDRGIREEIFVPHLDIDLASHTLTNLLRMLLEREPFTGHSPEQQFNHVIWPYVRGMCTSHGREMFRQYRVGT